MMQSLLTPAPVKNQAGEVPTTKDAKQSANLDKAPNSEQADFEKLMQETINGNQVIEQGELLVEIDEGELLSEQDVGESGEIVSSLPLDSEGAVVEQDISVDLPLESSIKATQDIDIVAQALPEPLETSETLETVQQIENSEYPEQIITPELLDRQASEPIPISADLINQDSDISDLSAVNTVPLEVPTKSSVTPEPIQAQVSTTEEPVDDALIQTSETSEQAQLINKIQESQQATVAVVSSNELNQRQQVSETWQGEIRDNNKKLVQEAALTPTLEGDESEKANLLESSVIQPKLAKVAIGEAVPTADTVAKGEIKGAVVDSGEQGSPISNTAKHESLASSQAPVDVNGAKPIQTNAVQSDKSVAINQQLQATNSLLQEPLDIKSKQAASMVGERVMMMISQGKQEVHIRLDPAELGSMTVKVQVQQDQVNLNIQTQAGVSKDIIEQNMPRLREQLAQQGIQLGDANVQQQSQQQGQQSQDEELGLASRSMNQSVDSLEQEDDAIWVPSPLGTAEQGIDFYA